MAFQDLSGGNDAAAAGDQLRALPQQAPPGIATAPLDMLSIANMLVHQHQAMMKMQHQFQQALVTVHSWGRVTPANTSSHLAPVRFDERAFRRLEKFTNEREYWCEWKMHLLTRVRECDASFAESLLKNERQEEPIELVQLSQTQSQLSAIQQARLIGLTGT